MLNGQNTTEEIKARLNIVDVVGSYVRLEKAGAHYKANCPFHQERTPSFMVNEERNMWHCFGCGKGGDIFAFVMEIEGLEFREALQMLAERAGVELPKYSRESEGTRDSKDRLYELLALATKFYEHQLWEGGGKTKVLGYLKGRGLSEESIRKFRLGYAPDGWQHLSEFLMKKGYAAKELEAAGLALKKEKGSGHYDRFRDRIMFPIFDILGRPIGFSARVAPGGDESQAKYINTPETALYHKSRALYGLSHAKQAMKQAGYTVIVEGNMDVIAMHQAGIENTVAVSGTALTDEQLTIMKRYGNEVRLFFDMDGAGQKAARKSAELALQKELAVSLIALESGKDAADIGKDDPEKLKAAVAAPLPAPKYFLQSLLAAHDQATPEGKRAITDDFSELLIAIKNPIERAFWIKELSREIGVEEKLLIGMVNQSFLERTRRDGPEPGSYTKPSQALPAFGSRAERLREELVALMCTDNAVRNGLLSKVSPDAKVFLEKHPLFFFVLQAGQADVLSLIEDQSLKSEASRLVFRLEESPDLIGLSGAERQAKMEEMGQGYLDDLEREVTKYERLRVLEQELTLARTHGDKEKEMTLLAEFAKLSAK
ncbi:MAG: DNA primase [Candidatus Moranbacteria bacterium RIFCSPHIGHO2_01_FULL_55_24]|nr:MAG: DNA primase [Candidatus Moranbacteria bacterium RIFCSPHIGHO2_01_FULL_55_24]